MAAFTILITKRTSDSIPRAMKQTIKSQYCSHDYGHLSIAKISQEKMFDRFSPSFLSNCLSGQRNKYASN